MGNISNLDYNFPALSLIYALHFYMFGSQSLLYFFLKVKVDALPMLVLYSGPGLENSMEAHLFKAKYLMNTDRVRLYFIGGNQLASQYFSWCPFNCNLKIFSLHEGSTHICLMTVFTVMDIIGKYLVNILKKYLLNEWK